MTNKYPTACVLPGCWLSLKFREVLHYLTLHKWLPDPLKVHEASQVSRTKELWMCPAKTLRLGATKLFLSWLSDCETLSRSSKSSSETYLLSVIDASCPDLFLVVTVFTCLCCAYWFKYLRNSHAWQWSRKIFRECVHNENKYITTPLLIEAHAPLSGCQFTAQPAYFMVEWSDNIWMNLQRAIMMQTVKPH